MTHLQALNPSSLWQTVANSKPAQFAQDNKVLTATAAGGSAVILKHVADHSELASVVIKKGLTPALAAGAAILGGKLIHDGLKEGLAAPVVYPDGQKEPVATGLGSGMAKVSGGTALAVTGTEITARSFGFSPLAASGKLALKVLSHPAVLPSLAAAPMIGMAAAGVQNMREKGVTVGNSAAVGLGSLGAGVFLAEANTPLIAHVALPALTVTLGASLGLGTYAMAKQTQTLLKEGQYGFAVLSAAGTGALGFSTALFAGSRLGLPVGKLAENLANQAAQKPLLAGSLAVVGLTAGAYLVYSQNEK